MAAQPAPAPSITSTPARIRDDAHALDVAKSFAKSIALTAVARDRDRRLPWLELDQLSASGLLSITVPREYGGPDVSAATLATVIATLAAADGSIGQIPQNHFYALEVLRVGGTDAQKQFFFGRALAGERFGNALAEIGHKDYTRRTRLVRRRDGDDVEEIDVNDARANAEVRVDSKGNSNGTSTSNGGDAKGAATGDGTSANQDRDLQSHIQGRKFYCTGAIFAHWIPTLVVADDDGLDVTYLAIVPRHAPGITITDDWDGFGQRVTGSGSVDFDHVPVDPGHIVPFLASFERPTTIGPVAQIMHAAIDLGIGQGAFDATLPFVRDHARPWIDAGVQRASDDPLVIRQTGDIAVQLRGAWALLRRAGRLVDAARTSMDEHSVAAASIAVAEARALTTTASLDAANRLFELCGTSATLDELGLDRFWRNARTHTLHDPVRWKYHAIGNYYLNDTLPPRHGAL